MLHIGYAGTHSRFLYEEFYADGFQKIEVDGKLLGVLNYNLMIPVEIDQLQEIDLVIHKRDRSQIKNYKELCK